MNKKSFKIFLLVCSFLLINIATCFAEETYGLNGVEIISSQNVNFSTPGDYVIVGKSKSSSIENYVFSIVTPTASAWKQLFYEENLPIKPEIILGRFMHNSNTQVIIWQRSGSGNYLDYKILGFVNGSAKTLLSKSGIYAGGIKVHNQEIVETSGGVNTLYIWTGTTFKGVVQKQEILDRIGTKDVLFTYSISPTHLVTVSAEKITLKVGQRFRWRQTSGNVKVRVLVTGEGDTIHFDEDNSFVATKVGKTQMTIIPDGYDWDNAKKIEIKIEK